MRSSNTITEEEFNTIERTRRDITIKLYRVELPETIRGFSRLNRNGIYQIFLNSTDCLILLWWMLEQELRIYVLPKMEP